MKLRPIFLTVMGIVLFVAASDSGHAAAPFYHPPRAYAEDGNRDRIRVSVDIESGSTTQTYDVPLRRAGLPVAMSLTADEAEDECDYKIAFEGRRYRFVRDACIWSMRFDRDLQLFLVDGGMEYLSAKTYLDKRIGFSMLTMRLGSATERRCTIVPGHKLGLHRAGSAIPDSLNAVVEHIARGLGNGQLSAMDYRCAPAKAVPALDTSRFETMRAH